MKWRVVRCNVESANLKILNVEALNVKYYYNEIFATVPNESACRGR